MIDDRVEQIWIRLVEIWHKIDDFRMKRDFIMSIKPLEFS
jgi:hypothetical protein